MAFMDIFVKTSEVNSLKSTVESLFKEKHALKVELEELKLRKRLEAEEIKHMQRINEEKMKAELEQEKIRLEKKYQEDISKFKEEQRVELVNSLKEFHGKMEGRFKSELENLKDVYKVLTEKLPNVNYNIEKKITQRV